MYVGHLTADYEMQKTTDDGGIDRGDRRKLY